MTGRCQRSPIPPSWSRAARRSALVGLCGLLGGCALIEKLTDQGGDSLDLWPDEETGDTGGTVETADSGESGDSGETAESGETAGETDTVPPGEPPLVDSTPPPTDAAFLDPERGWLDWVDLVDPGEVDELRAEGFTMAYAVVSLEDWRDRPLPDSLLRDLDAGFAEVRAAGIKVVLRFNYSGDSLDDAPLDVTMGHVAQLAPIIADNADVIATMQAGFLGAWGEWHSSVNGNDSDEARLTLTDALLDALPPGRTVQIRTPWYKRDLFGGPVDEARAFDGSALSRIGVHNDCFLASDTDYGTYHWEDPDLDRLYLAQDSRFLPVGGETCTLNPPRTDCATALDELGTFHWRYLNSKYNRDVLDEWVSEGCYEEVGKRLGHRLALPEVRVSERVAPGGRLVVDLLVHNEGFGAPYNPRPLVLRLSRGEERHEVELVGVDPRRWEPEVDHRVRVTLRVPAELAPGDWTLAAALPDPMLPNDGRYALHWAVDGSAWDPVRGEARLTTALPVDAAAPGDVDPTASELAVIELVEEEE